MSSRELLLHSHIYKCLRQWQRAHSWPTSESYRTENLSLTQYTTSHTIFPIPKYCWIRTSHKSLNCSQFFSTECLLYFHGLGMFLYRRSSFLSHWDSKDTRLTNLDSAKCTLKFFYIHKSWLFDVESWLLSSLSHSFLKK